MPYYPPGGAGASDGVNIVSAGTQNAGTNATVVFSNANNVSFGMNNSSIVTASASVAAGAGDGVNIVAAGTQTANTSGTVMFSNSNGVSFGMNNSSIVTATVKTDYQSSGNYLTTAAQSNQVVNSINGSTGEFTFNTGSSLSSSRNANSITFGLASNITTALQSAGAYLTTAMQSNAVTLSNIKVSGGTTSNNLSAITFADGNGVSFGLNASTLTATVKTDYQSSNANYLTSQSNQAFSASGGSSAFQTLNFANSNGLTFSNSNGSVMGSYTVPAVTDYFSKTNTTFNGTNVSGSITLNTNGIRLDVSANAGGAGDGVNILAAGSQTANTTGTVKLADSNGISFGMSNSSQITASYTVPSTAGLISAINVSGGTTSNNLSNVTFSDSNGVSFGLNGSVLTATVKTDYQSSNANYLTSQSNQAASGSNGSFTFQTLSFNNANGVSFGSNGSAITASYTVPTVTNSTLTISDANTSIGINRLAFTNSNGLTLALSTTTGGSATLTGSYTVPSTAGLISAINVSGGTTSNNLSKITFSDSNGISFGLNGSVMTATVKTDYQSSNANYLTSQSNQAVSAANGSYAFQTLSFSNANGMSFGTSAGSALTGSYTVPVVTDYFSKTNTTFNGANVSGSLTLNTNGLQVSLSAAAPGGGGGAAISGGANSQSTGTVNFANSNGITFGLSNNGTMTASHNGITQQSTQPVAASASNGSFNFSTLAFSNANNVTFGTSAGSIVTASVAAPGAAAENNWVNLLGANTAGNTTASGSTIGYSGINLTLSGTNNSVVNISAPATSSLSATGGLSISTNGSTISIGNGQYLSRYEYPEGIFTALGQTGQGSLSINHVYVPFNVTATAIKIGGSLSGATNTSATTASVNNSLWMGIYTLNGSSLSLASSGSANNGFQWSQSASSTGNTSINSMRQMTVPINVNMTPGQYWIAAVISQQTTYTSHGFTMYGNDRMASAATNAVLTPIGSGTTANRDAMLLQGIYTAATANGPNSIGGADINNTSASNVQRANFYWALYNATY